MYLRHSQWANVVGLIENLAMVVTAIPMSGKHVTWAQRNSPTSVQCAKLACFCGSLCSFDPSTGPWSLRMTSRAHLDNGDAGQLVISSGAGFS